jgi:hypothetical protein
MLVDVVSCRTTGLGRRIDMNSRTGWLAVALAACMALTATADGTVNVRSMSKQPLQGARVFLWEITGHCWITDSTSGADGAAKLTVSPKADYNLVVFCKGYKLGYKAGVRFAKPVSIDLVPLPAGLQHDIVTAAGIPLFGDEENDLACKGGAFQCLNDRCLIGFSRATETSIRLISQRQKFIVKKGSKQARCEVVCDIPPGIALEYRVTSMAGGAPGPEAKDAKDTKEVK